MGVFNSLFAAVFVALALCALSPAPADASSSSDLVVTVPIETTNGTPSIALHDSKSTFPVLLHNRGAAPIKLWTGGCSFGYYALTLEITDSSGKTHKVAKKPVVFKQNAPVTFTLAPGASCTIQVALASPAWTGAPLPQIGATSHVTIKAVYRIPADSFTRQHGVWTGMVQSKPIAATIVRDK